MVKNCEFHTIRADNYNNNTKPVKGGDFMKVNRASKSGRPTNQLRHGKTSQSHNGYVERPDRTVPSRLKSDEDESNRLLSIDIVYDKLQSMKEEYRQFYSEEQNFEDAWASLQEDPDHFIDHLIEVLEAHNHVVDALAEFDKTFETTHLDSLHKFVNFYEAQLTKLSIVIQPDSHLWARKRNLKEHFEKSPKAFIFLTHSGGFLRKLFDFYHNLKAIQPPTNQDEDQLAWYQGLFMDLKA